MKILERLGTVFFFGAMVFFAVQHFLYAIHFAETTMGYPWIPVPRWLAYFVGSLLVLVAFALTMQKGSSYAALSLAVLLLLRAPLAFGPILLATPRNGGIWTSFSELLAMAGASLFVAGSVDSHSLSSARWAAILRLSKRLGPFLFAVPLLVFGTQHFLYAAYIATLVPSWIPGHLFWTYLVGCAFLAAAIAILTRRLARLATILLGSMFCFWVILLHGPRIFHSPQNGFEWTSGFVALAMSGAAWIVSARDL